MSTATHTPGPWRALGQKHEICSDMVVDTHGELLALAISCDDEPTARANAQLIAAAPELLAALQAALAVIDDYLAYDHSGDPWEEDARTMGEMDINDYQRDGRLESARTIVAKAAGSAA